MTASLVIGQFALPSRPDPEQALAGGCRTCCGAACDIGEVPSDQGALLPVLVLGRRAGCSPSSADPGHVGQPAVILSRR